MIQTNYVPLEHPYRVVYYNGVIGIQIGSLILAIEKQDEEGKRIVEIKTHPEADSRLCLVAATNGVLNIVKPLLLQNITEEMLPEAGYTLDGVH